ncbi:predicted protein [Histoplasma capsulatum G186AR]|uniref:Uncharacterized protein n=1 Tax=Ajellomyces capsulatus (strain G186AR / H82 / ATCC MYA-2454 / RMSCC 2432) TaxID=447093 RepID=C0NK08_AJECG|nr:uncharacterized protein HCBG_03488 [Histoplasma capsulatum G186AR]EEH08199.1 predicted protein [Histoplasma capsulatum G186AR]
MTPSLIRERAVPVTEPWSLKRRGSDYFWYGGGARGVSIDEKGGNERRILQLSPTEICSGCGKPKVGVVQTHAAAAKRFLLLKTRKCSSRRRVESQPGVPKGEP